MCNRPCSLRGMKPGSAESTPGLPGSASLLGPPRNGGFGQLMLVLESLVPCEARSITSMILANRHCWRVVQKSEAMPNAPVMGSARIGRFISSRRLPYEPPHVLSVSLLPNIGSLPRAADELRELQCIGLCMRLCGEWVMPYSLAYGETRKTYGLLRIDLRVFDLDSLSC